ncbi:phospholipase A(1) DAD1, chloroplastic [Eucalyptus grandis]|uniref:phospholipase A(1) DAD1, chloroplastic n=1 Tax=Eucalyptus grandis TaxID=71139 RepID=UPI00192E9528|nr:phospholipase A(1) DAD1, chloroplastic [Eucalyptus grandis]
MRAAVPSPGKRLAPLFKSRTPSTNSVVKPASACSCFRQLKHRETGRTTIAAKCAVVCKKKWTEYQGIDNWEGLLDPLDDNLRREILRYGEFVEATYRSFDFNPSSPTYGTSKHPKSSLLARAGIRGTGYRVTRYLHATCGVQMPHWASNVPSWMGTRSSWIGFVAVCKDGREISRLGRRDVVIALRGTGTCLEWIENLRANLTCVGGDGDGGAEGPMVGSGYLSLYTSKTATNMSLQDIIREEVARIINKYSDRPLSLTITGHSLGAALAILSAYDISSNFSNAPMVTVISFGGPRVGNRAFRHLLEKSKANVLRIVNSDDLVTKVPGLKDDVARLPWLFRESREHAPSAYTDVGRELRLSSRECPYLSSVNLATCHELKTYLQLISGFVSSKCPFRATAKKVLNVNNSRSRDKGQYLN